MQTSFIQRFFRTLILCSLVGVGLLVVGCDSSGSNGDDSPWTGKWEVTEASSGIDLGEVDAYYDITKEEFTTVFVSDQNCDEETEDIIEIDGNQITTEDRDTGETTTGLLEVKDNGNLSLERVDGDGSVTAKSVDSVPSCN